jgi:hypothetical protein
VSLLAAKAGWEKLRYGANAPPITAALEVLMKRRRDVD